MSFTYLSFLCVCVCVCVKYHGVSYKGTSFDFICLCSRPVFQRVSGTYYREQLQSGDSIGHDIEILLTSQDRNRVRRNRYEDFSRNNIHPQVYSHMNVEFWLSGEGKMLFVLFCLFVLISVASGREDAFVAGRESRKRKLLILSKSYPCLWVGIHFRLQVEMVVFY